MEFSGVAPYAHSLLSGSRTLLASSSSGELFRTLPTPLLTSKASISSAGCDGIPGAEHQIFSG
jgi:hypothetical protein